MVNKPNLLNVRASFFQLKEKVPENLLTSKKVMFLLFCFLEQMLKRATDRQRFHCGPKDNRNYTYLCWHILSREWFRLFFCSEMAFLCVALFLVRGFHTELLAVVPRLVPLLLFSDLFKIETDLPEIETDRPDFMTI